jgi:hypothetical protein
MMEVRTEGERPYLMQNNQEKEGLIGQGTFQDSCE